MSRLDRIVDNYEVKLRLGAAGRLSEREIRARVERFSIFAAREDVVLNQTRQVLCSHGVATMMFPAYHAFSRELGKLTREAISVETLQRAMMAAAEKWTMRGLRREALLDIAINIYHVYPPPDQSDTQ
jgi:hypothetical protein